MADPITWGLITKVKSIASSIKTTVESTQTTVDTLPEKVEQKLDPVQTDMTQLAENVQKQVDELREIVENSPAGVPAPWLESISSASQENGINVTYKARFLQGRVDSTENWLFGQTNGVMVRYSDENYPISRTDGTLAFIDEDLFTVSENGTVTAKTKNNVIVGLTNGEKYFISAFPYSTYNVYNESLNQGSGLNNTTSCTWTGTKGTLIIDVTQDYEYKTLGEITATMTPTTGGSALTQKRTGSGQIVFSNLDAGQYTLSFSEQTYFPAPSNQDITIIAGQPNETSAAYLITDDLSKYTWEEITTITKNGDAAGVFSLGKSKQITIKTYSGNFRGAAAQNATSSTTMDAIIVGINLNLDVGGYSNPKRNIVFCTKGFPLYGYYSDFGPFTTNEDIALYNYLATADETFTDVYEHAASIYVNMARYHSTNVGQNHVESRAVQKQAKLFVPTGKNIGWGYGSGPRFPYFSTNESRQLDGNKEWVTTSIYARNGLYENPQYTYYAGVDSSGAVKDNIGDFLMKTETMLYRPICFCIA